LVRFLIIRFSSIGDIVLTTPVIRCLKNQVEDAEIHFLSKKAFIPVLINNPYIDRFHVLDNSLGDVIKDLKERNFDYIIDLHHNLRTSVLKSRLNVLAFSFNKLNIQKWLLVNFKIDQLAKVHIVDRYFETVKLFDIVNDGKGLDYFIAPADEISIDCLPLTHRNGYVGFVIGAKHLTKKLPLVKIVSIIEKLNLPVVLMGGKEDIQDGEFIKQYTGALSYNACGQYNLGQSASLVRQANVIITHDTGLMHIAAAFKKKIISVWGNTVPEFGMYPYLSDPGSQIIEVKGLKCRPCTKIGFKECPRGHFKCMNMINEDDLVDVAKKLYR
jgi:ADP-heptose:LPS heptosyltransferase